VAKTSTVRNPAWSRDELILALDLYVRFKGNPPGKTSESVVQLSELLNEIGAKIAHQASDFRNPNGVYMKTMNFRRFDPAYTAQGKKGLQRGGKLEEDIWNDFANAPRTLAETASAIRLIVKNGRIPRSSLDEEDELADAEEGRILTRVHRSRERSRELVERKKALMLKAHGRLACEACSFDFEVAYGERGRGFIEAHHVKPVHTLVAGEKTRLEDLALLCSNCHRMIHARRPWLTIDEVKGLVRRTVLQIERATPLGCQ
jgi:5-methylcytosine-specific restriction protein A